MRDARWAGSQPAIAPTAVSVRAAVTSVTLSRGWRSYKRLAMNCDDQALTTVPMVTPSATSMKTRTSTNRRTVAGSAPSANRIPISARRLVTAYDVTP